MKTALYLAVLSLAAPTGLTSARAQAPATPPTPPAPAAQATSAASAPAADLNRVRSLLALGRTKAALPLAEAAAQAAPNDAAAHLLYGRALAGENRVADAIRELTTATTLDPKSAAAFTALGDAQYMRYAEELRDWVKAHPSDMLGNVHGSVPTVTAGAPGSSATLWNDELINDRSSAQMTPREWDKFCGIAKSARTAYEGALALSPGDRKAMRGKGLMQLVLGEWKSAADAFDAAGVPDYDSFLYELSRNAYDAHSMGPDALRIWEKAAESNPTEPWVYWYLRDLYDEFRHSDWRYDYLDAMCHLFGNRIQDQSDSRRYTPKDVQKDLVAFTGKHADFAPGWRGLGMAAQAAKDRGQAVAAFEKAVALNPADWYSHLQLGITQLNEKGDAAAQKARAALTQAAKQNPESALAWHALGTAAERGKDPDGAVTAYERAAEIAPNWADAHYRLAALLLDRRQGAEALPHLERYLELSPDGKDAKEVRTAVEQLKKLLAQQG